MRFVEDVIITGRGREEVFAYVSNFNLAHEWRTEVVESRMLPHGPMHHGSLLIEVAKVAGRRVITESVVDHHEFPDRWTFAHQRGPVPVSGGFVLRDARDGVRVSYTLDLPLRGLWVLLTPYLRWSGRRTIQASLSALEQIMSGQSAAEGAQDRAAPHAGDVVRPH